jgi:hypothetical protein
MRRPNIVPTENVQNIFTDSEINNKHKKTDFKSKSDPTTVYKFYIESGDELKLKDKINKNNKQIFFDKTGQLPLDIIENGIDEFDNSIDFNGSIDINLYVETGRFSLENSDIKFTTNNSQITKNLVTNQVFFDNRDNSFQQFEDPIHFSDDLSNVTNNVTNVEIKKTGVNITQKTFSPSGFTYKSSKYSNGIDSIVFGGKTK